MSRLASGKLARGDLGSEGSRTAKICTEEHKAHKRLVILGKHAQQCEAFKPTGMISRCVGNRWKEGVLTEGGLHSHELAK